jgi:hypothetical protein
MFETSMVSENPVMPPRAIGLTPILPVTADWGTVEMPDFARITKAPEAPRPTGAGPVRVVSVVPSALLPVIPLSSCVQPATSAASRIAPNPIFTCPNEFLMIVPPEEHRRCEAA